MLTFHLWNSDTKQSREIIINSVFYVEWIPQFIASTWSNKKSILRIANTVEDTMITLKMLRGLSGHTQKSLAEATGLSIRTIQRLEADNSVPKGYTLRVLSDVLNMEPAALRTTLQCEPDVLEAETYSLDSMEDSELQSIKWINLSILAFFIIPFGNVILPFILWRKQNTSKIVREAGRKIINIQIYWSVCLMFLLSLAPFIGRSLNLSTPLILWVLLIALLVNITIIGFTANALNKGKTDILNIPLQLI